MTQVIEGLILFVVLVIIFSQIVFPAVDGKSIFPALNPERTKAKEELESDAAQAEVEALKEELTARKAKRATTPKEKK